MPLIDRLQEATVDAERRTSILDLVSHTSFEAEFEHAREEILDRFVLQHGCLNEAILTRAGEQAIADLIVRAVNDSGHPTHRRRMSPEEEAHWLIDVCGFRL